MRKSAGLPNSVAAGRGWRWSLNSVVTSGLIGALLLLIFVTVLGIRTISVFVQTTLWVSQTRNMLEELRQWFAQIEITDSDEVRYLTADGSKFKQAVEIDKSSTQTELNDVLAVVKNDPEHRATIERIRRLADAQTEFMNQRTFELEHHQRLQEGWMDKSNELLWDVRRAITDMIASESASLNSRSLEAERMGQRVMVIGPASMALSLCILILMVFLLNREVSQRIDAEAEIWEANKQLDQRIQDRTAALRTALDELEGFSYSVAHDLRAPVRAIGGYAGILSETCSEKLSDEGRDLLNTVEKEAARMGHLIDDLLRFSRVGRQTMRPSTVDMTQFARDAFRDLADAAPKRKIDFRLSSLPEVSGDAAMLRQVWVNLLSNAIKFTAGKESSVIEVSQLPSASELIYCVRDNGAGFDMQYAGNLFKPFQRLHENGEFQGTGIGLALVERIIRRHGGRVWAEGEPGHGAAFYFALPRNQP